MQDTQLVNPDALLTPAEASEELRSSKEYVWSLCRSEKLKHMRKGRQILIRRQDLVEYIAAQIIG